MAWGIIEPKCSLTKFYKTLGPKNPRVFVFIKEEMTNEQEIMSFQKKLEERNFIFNDKLLEQLFKAKMERLRRQAEHNFELRHLTKRR